MQRFLKFTAVFLAASLGRASACGLALALAVDVSGSVDSDEYSLQMGGLADALRDPTVAEALARENSYVMLVHWSGTNRQAVSVPWTHVDTVNKAHGLAAEIDGAARSWRNFSTGIGEALEYTVAQFEDVKSCKRKVIDVSGDGVSNEGIAPGDLRDWLVAQDFAVNGLAIESDVDGLTAYYETQVIAGPGSFALRANDFDDYPRRIRQKLLREITKAIAMK